MAKFSTLFECPFGTSDSQIYTGHYIKFGLFRSPFDFFGMCNCEKFQIAALTMHDSTLQNTCVSLCATLTQQLNLLLFLLLFQIIFLLKNNFLKIKINFIYFYHAVIAPQQKVTRPSGESKFSLMANLVLKRQSTQMAMDQVP